MQGENQWVLSQFRSFYFLFFLAILLHMHRAVVFLLNPANKRICKRNPINKNYKEALQEMYLFSSALPLWLAMCGDRWRKAFAKLFVSEKDLKAWIEKEVYMFLLMLFCCSSYCDDITQLLWNRVKIVNLPRGWVNCHHAGSEIRSSWLPRYSYAL